MGSPNQTSNSHKYLRLAKYFREQVQSGALKPGDRLPSFAQMQADHGIGQGTLERAYALLEQEKIIIREPKRGTFVAELKPQSTLGIIGVASGRPPKECPYYRDLLEGVQDVAYREKVEILLLHEGSSAGLEKMDGLITTDSTIRVPPTMPCMSLVRESGTEFCVVADDEGGAEMAVNHLLELGHRRIAYLILGGHSNRLSETIVKRRLEGYKKALKKAGIEPDRAWVKPLRDPWEEMTSFIDLGYEKMKRWLQDDWRELGCTAILAHNDETAMGIYRAVREAGLTVPDDISVVGFDGTEIADHMRPKLTTIAVPLHEIGATGMEMLLGMVHQQGGSGHMPGEEQVKRILPTRLRVQESTGPCRAS